MLIRHKQRPSQNLDTNREQLWENFRNAKSKVNTQLSQELIPLEDVKSTLAQNKLALKVADSTKPATNIPRKKERVGQWRLQSHLREDPRPPGISSYWILDYAQEASPEPACVRCRTTHTSVNCILTPKQSKNLKVRSCDGSHTQTILHQRSVKFEELKLSQKVTHEVSLLGYDNEIYRGQIPEDMPDVLLKVNDSLGHAQEDFDLDNFDWGELLDMSTIWEAVRKTYISQPKPRYVGGRHTLRTNHKGVTLIPSAMSQRRRSPPTFTKGYDGRMYRGKKFQEKKPQIQQQDEIKEASQYILTEQKSELSFGEKSLPQHLTPSNQTPIKKPVVETPNSEQIYISSTFTDILKENVGFTKP